MTDTALDACVCGQPNVKCMVHDPARPPHCFCHKHGGCGCCDMEPMQTTTGGRVVWFGPKTVSTNSTDPVLADLVANHKVLCNCCS